MKVIKECVGSIILGLILLVGGACLLWFNEGNNVKNIKTVAEARDAVIDISSDKIDNKNDGKLIATSGDLIVNDESVTDSVFNVGMKTAKLVRTVEMYQWKEETDTDSNGNTTYSYNKVWSEDIIDSSTFTKPGHDNPNFMQFQSDVFYADSVNVGNFTLSKDLIAALPAQMGYINDETIVLPEGYHMYNQYVITGENLKKPAIGDIKIHFSYNKDEKVSVLGVQKDSGFVPYVSSQNKQVLRIESGVSTGNQMLDHITTENNLLKWGLRLLGVILMAAAGASLFRPLSMISSLIPLFGKTISKLFSFIGSMIGVAVSFVVIAISWIAFRPLIGILLIVLAIAIVGLVIFLFNKNKQKTEVGHVVQFDQQM